MTKLELIAFINEKLADASLITPEEHRDVEKAIVEFADQKTKILKLESFTTDRNYSLDTGISEGNVITRVSVMLECKNNNNGFVVGDHVTAPTPYPADSGRTSAQGIGIQYNGVSKIRIMVNDQLCLMTPYNSAANANANNVLLSGSATDNWKIKIYVDYQSL
jgi:hypothetical protein